MKNDPRLANFFVGLGIGIVVGILLAPESGSETRSHMRVKARDGGEYLRRRSSELKETASNVINRGRGGYSSEGAVPAGEVYAPAADPYI